MSTECRPEESTNVLSIIKVSPNSINKIYNTSFLSSQVEEEQQPSDEMSKSFISKMNRYLVVKCFGGLI